MAEHVFKLLLCLIGNIRKEAEGRDINEGVLVKGADVAGKQPPLRHCPCSLKHIFRKTQAFCKIIGTSRRDISHRNDLAASQDPGHHLVRVPSPPPATTQSYLLAFS